MEFEHAAEEYAPDEKFESIDITEFMEKLDGLDGQTPLAWKDAKAKVANPGIWVVRGKYKLNHGSFIDPSDLSCYGAQFYVAEEAGKHDCVQLGYGDEGPEGSKVAQTLGELRGILEEMVPEIAEVREKASSENQTVEGQDAESAENDVISDTVEPIRLPKILQPDSAFEKHGALTKGWSATEYFYKSDDGEEDIILVFG